ncbi:MAG TPA: helix-turn-helix transcriptional regulator [Candidatus Paceibacterota bacterium]
MQEINKKIGQRIREAREAKGLTQKQLGEYLGYSSMGISYFEQGVREMKISDIQRLASYFGKEPSYFLSAGLTVFRAEKTSPDKGIVKSLDDFDKFLLERRKKSEQ